MNIQSNKETTNMRPLTILITGATSGIGRHAALHLAARGHRVIATGRSARALDELRAADARLSTLRLDVTDQGSVDEARQAVMAMTGGEGLDVLVNNAGYGALGPTEMISDADMRAQYEVNVFGLMAVTRAFLPRMRERGQGRVVNVSSLGGLYTLPFFGVYNSTKYAVESLSDGLRVELAPFGVHVSLIEPGVIETGFTDRSMVEAEKTRRPGSPYAPILDRAEELRKMSDRTAVGPECISRAIEKAATSRRPRARYVAPLRAQIMVGVLRALPTRWADFIMRQMVGLTRRRLALPSRALAAAAMIAVLGVALAPSVSHADEAASQGWERVRTEDGIVVSRKEIPGSPFVAFRGEGDVDAPILTVGDVLVDVPHEKDWIDGVVDATILRKVSDTEYIMYSHLGMPVPLSDRELVTDVTLTLDAAKKTLTVRMRSVADASAPKTGYVRAQIEDSVFVLASVDGGKRTHVTAEIHCDPKGSVPAFIVNLFQRNWGYKTITSLRRQAQRPAVTESAQLHAMLAEKGLLD
jgi:NAD(P)-dependent dehydrogenase (short-subunit alcohol dehydrogenase family)